MRDFQGVTRESVRRRRAIHRGWRAGLLLVLLVLVGGVTVWSDGFAVLRGDSGEAARSGAGSLGGDAEPRELAAVESGDSGEPVNILVLGVDRRPEDSTEPAVAGERADTIMLAQVTPETGRIELLSIPRDLVVEIEPGVEDRINASYAYNGLEGAISSVSDYTGLPVHHYAVVDFEGFEDVVRAMGGLTIELEEGQYPPGWPMEPGVHTLKGHKALVYARYRKTAGGDLDRIKRQQQVVAALRSQAFDWSTVKEVPAITRAVSSNVETDMSFGEMLSFGKTLLKSGRGATLTAEQLEGRPVTTDEGEQVLEPKQQENELILQDFRP